MLDAAIEDALVILVIIEVMTLLLRRLVKHYDDIFAT